MEKPKQKHIVLRLPVEHAKAIKDAAERLSISPQNLIYDVLSGRKFVLPPPDAGSEKVNATLRAYAETVREFWVEPLDLPRVYAGNPALKKTDK